MTDLAPAARLTGADDAPFAALDGSGPQPGFEGSGRMAWRRFRRHRLAMIGLVGLVLIALVFIVGPLWSDFDVDTRTGVRRGPPTWEHPFGTDEIQRDLFVRTMVGGRYSLLVGLLVAVTATAFGALLGTIAGFAGGWVDTLVGQVINLVLIVPALVVLAVFAYRFGGGPVGISLVVACLLWTRMARVARGVVLGYKEQEFVMAARGAGASSARIIGRHILPNVIGPVVVEVTLLIGTAIVLESTLSFLGLGVQPPTPTLGNLVLEAKGYIDDQPRRVLVPGVLVVLIVICVNFVGDGLRDALDPRSRTARP